MLKWVHAQWQVFLGIGIFIAVIPINAFINVKFKLVPRRGFLRMETTLGLRFFMGMMALIYINLISLLLIPGVSVAVPFSGSVVLLLAIMIWG